MNNIEDKIKHLLAIAHDPSASEHERESAMNKAHSWMLKHGIEVAHEETRESVTISTSDYMLKGVYAEAQAQMIYFVALSYKSFDMVLQDLPHTSDVMLTVAGPTEQMDEIMRVLDSICHQSNDERKAWAKRTLAGAPRAYQKKQIKSFYLGYGSRVADRVEDILEHESSQRDRQALVIVRDRATKHLENLYDTETRGSKRRTVTSGFFAGEQAGDRAQLNNQLG